MWTLPPKKNISIKDAYYSSYPCICSMTRAPQSVAMLWLPSTLPESTTNTSSHQAKERSARGRLSASLRQRTTPAIVGDSACFTVNKIPIYGGR
jgi:hypothetical protein